MIDGPLSVERVMVQRDRIMVLVRVPEGPAAHLTEAQRDYLLSVRPRLARHACINAQGQPFGAIMAETSLPHVLEHLIIDFQAELSRGAVSRSFANAVSADKSDGTSTADAQSGRTRSPLTFVGTTEWLSEREGLARIEVNFTDDLIALDALKRACALLDEGMVATL